MIARCSVVFGCLLLWLSGCAPKLSHAAAGPTGTPNPPSHSPAPPPSHPQIQPLALKAITWNIQYGSNGGADSNGWPARKVLVAEALKDERPDVFCAQEVLPGQLDDLKAALGAAEASGAGAAPEAAPEAVALAAAPAKYGVVAVGRDGAGQGEHAPVFYRTDRFELRAQGTFWYNEATDKPGKDWDKEYNRICTWVELQDKASGRVFRVWNSHFPLNADGRVKAAALLAARVKAAGDIPALVVGDFNEPLGSQQFPVLKECGLVDSYGAAGKNTVTTTFRWKGVGVTRIDWVLTRGEWKTAVLRTVDREKDGVHASDHNALVAEVELAGE